MEAQNVCARATRPLVGPQGCVSTPTNQPCLALHPHILDTREDTSQQAIISATQGDHLCIMARTLKFSLKLLLDPLYCAIAPQLAIQPAPGRCTSHCCVAMPCNHPGILYNSKAILPLALPLATDSDVDSTILQLRVGTGLGWLKLRHMWSISAMQQQMRKGC